MHIQQEGEGCDHRSNTFSSNVLDNPKFIDIHVHYVLLGFVFTKKKQILSVRKETCLSEKGKGEIAKEKYPSEQKVKIGRKTIKSARNSLILPIYS
jgi:hypothetical protein